jgi:hypothetical protein
MAHNAGFSSALCAIAQNHITKFKKLFTAFKRSDPKKYICINSTTVPRANIILLENSPGLKQKIGSALWATAPDEFQIKITQ